MREYCSPKVLRILLLGTLLCGLLPVADVAAKQPKAQSQSQSQNQNLRQQSLTAAQAAARAKAQHGGKVLKVSPRGDAYRVKLLTKSGRVLTVTVKD